MQNKNQTGNSPSSTADVLVEVADYNGPDRVVSSIEFAEMIKANPKPSVTLTSGVVSLDEAVRGFVPGELIVVSGPTAMGKTLLCDTIIRRMKSDHHLSLFFTFEVTPEVIALAHADPESVLFLPLQHVAMDMNWIRYRCLEAKIKYGCEAVFIDHLHYLIDMGATVNMSLEIGRVMRYLKKNVALAMNLAVFLVCHVKQLDMESEPSIYHLRDSSFVGQEADTVLMVWRRWDLDSEGKKLDTRNQGLATIKVEKARRSGVMGTKIKIKKEGSLLVESNNEPEHVKTKSTKDKPEWEWLNK